MYTLPEIQNLLCKERDKLEPLFIVGGEQRRSWAAVNAAHQGGGIMDPSMFVAYTHQANGVPLESKLATYMVLYILLSYLSSLLFSVLLLYTSINILCLLDYVF